jgi:hypothetical protein
MPSRRTTKAAQAAAAAMPSIPKELIDQFVMGPMSAEAVSVASMALKKALIEPALDASFHTIRAIRTGRTSPRRRATTATAPAARRFSSRTGRCASKCRATARHLRAAADSQARAPLHEL